MTSNVPAPKLEFAMRIEGDIREGQAIDEHLQIVDVPSGRVEGPGIKGEIVPPTGDWLEIGADGTMRLDVRMSVKMDDGSYVYITYTGRIVPNEALGAGIENNTKVNGADLYFVTNPVARTSSKKYGWMNQALFLGRNASVEFGSGDRLGLVAYDVYKVEA